LHIIVENVGRLNDCRDELNKQISKERRNFIWMLFGMVIAAVGAVAAVLQYLDCLSP
jgi:hypothetical protein